MSYYCSQCTIHWAPFHCLGDGCPQCGGGTVRKQEAVDDDADTLFKNIKRLEREDDKRQLADKEVKELHEKFSAFYLEYDAARYHEEWRQTTPL